MAGGGRCFCLVSREAQHRKLTSKRCHFLPPDERNSIQYNHLSRWQTRFRTLSNNAFRVAWNAMERVLFYLSSHYLLSHERLMRALVWIAYHRVPRATFRLRGRRRG